MEEWKTIEPDVWKPEKEGDSIEGVLLHKEPKMEKLSARYKLEAKDGFKLVWGSTVLDDRMELVQVGQEIRITYKGKVKNAKKQDVNIYKVEVKKKVE